MNLLRKRLVVAGFATALMLVTSCGQARPTRPANPAGTRQAASGPVKGRRSPGGIQGFGMAAVGSEYELVATVVRRYARAIASNDGAEACTQLVTAVRQQFVELGATASTHKETTCPALIDRLIGGKRSGPVEKLAAARIVAVRVGGNRAFVLLKAAPTPLEFVPLDFEQGRWRLTALAPTIVPSNPTRAP